MINSPVLHYFNANSMHYFCQNSLHYLHYFELLFNRSFTIRIQTVELRARSTTKGYLYLQLFPFTISICTVFL